MRNLISICWVLLSVGHLNAQEMIGCLADRAVGNVAAPTFVIRTTGPIETSTLDLKSAAGSLIPADPQPEPPAPFTFFLSNTPQNYSVGAALGSSATLDGDFLTGVGWREGGDDLVLEYGHADFHTISFPFVGACPQPVPEPAGSALLLCGGIGLLALRRRRDVLSVRQAAFRTCGVTGIR